MRRLIQTSVLTLGMLVALAAPAFAHASFDIQQVPAGATETYSLRVPLEREAGNQEVAMLVSSGWTIAACEGADGWTCTFGVNGAGDQTVTFERDDDGAGGVERFALTLTAPDTPGVYGFPLVQVYDDGTEVAWIEGPGSDHPEPRIQVGDSDSVIERDATTPTHGGADGDGPGTEAATPTIIADGGLGEQRSDLPDPAEVLEGDLATPAPSAGDDATAAGGAEIAAIEGYELDDGPSGLLIVGLGGVILVVALGVVAARRRAT